jgi:mannose-6-phosphate isomerase-like protein (cupin superfamily)
MNVGTRSAVQVNRTIGRVFGLVGTLFLTTYALAEATADIDTGVVSRSDAAVESHAWGELLTYFAGESYSTQDALAAVAVIKPGQEIHPPHVHAEEEYLMVLEGNGTWSVEGEEFPAAAGDVLYAAPWDEHGISNTGDVPLRFVVFKWNPKPVEPAPAP